MQRFNTFRVINVFQLELSEWTFPVHSHSFYELILIGNGSGQHILNDVTVPYKKGDVFFMMPGDTHAFEIKSKTTFLFLKFTEQVFSEKLSGNVATRWSAAVKSVLHAQHHISGNILTDRDDALAVQQLVEIILKEYTRKHMYSREAVLELFGAIMTIVARNILGRSTAQPEGRPQPTERITLILAYIRTHAFDSKKSSLSAIAKEFSMSANYVGIFVRKQTGLSVNQHIMRYKMQTATDLLKQDHLNINEIAARLGFNDASHFNKLFQKYQGVSPGKYRRG